MTHGRPGSYNAGCKCPLCREAWRAYHRHWSRDRKAGKRRMVSATEARAHVMALREAGMTYEQIARSAGVVLNTAWKIGNGQVSITHRSTADSLLGVTVTDRAKDLPRPSAEAVKMIDALNRAGLRDIDIRRMAKVRPDQVRRRSYVYPVTFNRLEIICRLLARDGRIDATVLP